jgi:hypothetical protein
MTDQDLKINARHLAAAFPAEVRSDALLAGAQISRCLDPRYRTEQFAVLVDEQIVEIPSRLCFVSHGLGLLTEDSRWPLARALQTRSTDGFQRQNAIRDLLDGLPTWGAPYVVKLIGEYVVEILDDIFAAMTTELERTLAAFILDNPIFWGQTRQRVASYWNAYYRHGDGSEDCPTHPHSEYVGFKLIDRLEMAAARHIKNAKA